jgi:hypothetical protein
MPDELIQSIKNIAHRVSEDYLLFGKNMNNSIVEAYLGGEIGNEEILKRICEHANQNVYLGLFNDPSVNKANIIFDLAEFNQIIPIIRESELAMNDLKIPPTDFRSKNSSLIRDAAIPERYNETSDEQGDDMLNSAKSVEKQAELHGFIQNRDVMKNFVDKLAMMKCSEEKLAEYAFEKMKHDAKIIVAKGDSIGDLAKLASRNIKDIGGDFTKIAMAYEQIKKELSDNGFNVNSEFTKLSSMKVNSEAEVLQPSVEFYLSLSKIAALSEMHEATSKILNAFNKTISDEIKK